MGLGSLQNIQLQQVRKAMQYMPGLATEDEVNSLAQVREILTVLLQQNRYQEVVVLIANSLPAEQALWWGYLCCKYAESEEAYPGAAFIQQLAKQWVYEPTVGKTRAALAFADYLGLKSGSGWLARTLHATAKLPVDRPRGYGAKPEFFGIALSMTIVMCMKNVVANGDMSETDIYQRFIRQGLHIANGGNGEIYKK